MKKLLLAVAMIMVLMIGVYRADAAEMSQPVISDKLFFEFLEDPELTTDKCVQVAAAIEKRTIELSDDETLTIEKECEELQRLQRQIVADKKELERINKPLFDSIACIYNRWKFFTEMGIQNRRWDKAAAEQLGEGAEIAWGIIVMRERSNLIYHWLRENDPDGTECQYIFTFMQSVSCPPVKPPVYRKPPEKEDKPEKVDAPIFPDPVKIEVFYVDKAKTAFCPCMWTFSAKGAERSEDEQGIECYIWSILPAGVTLDQVQDVWLIGDFNHWVDGDGGNPPTLAKLKSRRYRKYRIPRMDEDGIATFLVSDKEGMKFIEAMTHIKEVRWLFALELKDGRVVWTDLSNFAFAAEKSWACGIYQDKSHGAVMSLYPKSFETKSRYRISAMSLGE